jgi:hypothetical protein
MEGEKKEHKIILRDLYCYKLRRKESNFDFEINPDESRGIGESEEHEITITNHADSGKDGVFLHRFQIKELIEELQALKLFLDQSEIEVTLPTQ